MGVDISVKKLEIARKKIALQIWDFVGEYMYRTFLPIYARGASGGIFMYDITRFESLINLKEWLKIFNNATGESEKKIPLFIVGGKCDLYSKRTIIFEDAINLMKSFNISEYIECSSKTGQNVNIIFEKLTLTMMENAGFI